MEEDTISRSMRLLIVVHGYPPTHNGGAERRAERTARQLAARGYDVRVLTVEAGDVPSDALYWEDSIQHDIAVRRLFFDYRTIPEPVVWEYDNPAIGAALEDLIGQWKPDVLHLFSGYMMSGSIVHVARRAQIPVIVSLTDYWWLCHRINLLRTNGTRCAGPTAAGCARCRAEMKRRFRVPSRAFPQVADALWNGASQIPLVAEYLGLPAQAKRYETLIHTLHQAQVLISPSYYLANFYIDHGIDRDRVRVWRQGVDIDHCRLPQPARALQVGYIGQIKPHKGVDLLLDAWRKLQSDRPRSLSLYGSAAGDAAYARKIRKQIRSLPDTVWHGEFHGADLWNVLAEIDLLVVPSRWVENSPNTILEAQAMGIPVIGSNLGGVAELIRHGKNGLLFHVDNADDLAVQLQSLLDDPSLLAQLRRSPIDFVNIDLEIDRLCALYEEQKLTLVSNIGTG